MLDSVTKRRIDTARDILVGKVPDPKSQVEQITIALIYKFMDDMDAEAEELGGKRKFFTGDFTRYGWAKLMSAGIGGHELIGLYGEGITTMPQNPGIPLLFRDIFKNAYLPYRDPETLKSFLKIIDEFSYDHSERLGDAFEYLLSVLGSQGDAGQFRTPRHIIDFIVEVMAPKKGEMILDPACGTAGFLISAYKYILRTNIDAKNTSTLTPDEKGRIAKNFQGYDISPDMVRLSLVNLYLHGFSDPHIVEYDTLTSEERWNESADVILANPPFMSPKGGIKPHKRFSIQAKRSEVLFVDYIAEHLTPTGRAGIIVPEGIIFQSQNAYKELRKMLVENSLVAVVSLPAGVFQPYSGVKTSILILDKSLAKQSHSVAFFKIENDGFGLGAQRRANGGEQLTQVKIELAEYLQALRRQQATDKLQPTLGLIVAKEKIAANGDYNLSGERYREIGVSSSKFPKLRLGDVCTLNPLKSELRDLGGETSVSFVPMADLNEHRISFRPSEEKRLSEVSNSYTYFKDNDVLLAKVTPCFENGKAGIARNLVNGIGFGSSEYYVLRTEGLALPEWIYFCVTHPIFRDSAIAQMTGTGGLQRVPRSYVENFEIPLPPLEVQKEIVAEIEGYQKVINGARTVLDHYRPHIPIHLDWPVFELSEVSTKITDGAHFTPTYTESGVPFLRVTDITGSNTSKKFIPQDEHNELIKRCRPEKGDVLYSKNGTIGIAKLIDWDWEFSIFVSLALIKPKRELLDPHYLACFLNSDTAYAQATARSKSGTVTNLHLVDIKTIKIPLPPLATQQAIVAEIEAEQALVAANRELMIRFEKKVQATIARAWGEEDLPEVEV
ncbi:N-6 DNA methylase [Glaciimonas sp. PCH181]|uniref:N-6 DNA methylase n=1 Tax=Glaciimonas sp. PCH181 TaxID=2133943 RepID=UPI000D356F6F|nr:N-6 DNA methylase [Glaciimonas sp. PCH181]PUA17320.1 N-6 DNA methylase [Glaciimonas sp. PCH181]